MISIKSHFQEKLSVEHSQNNYLWEISFLVFPHFLFLSDLYWNVVGSFSCLFWTNLLNIRHPNIFLLTSLFFFFLFARIFSKQYLWDSRSQYWFCFYFLPSFSVSFLVLLWSLLIFFFFLIFQGFRKITQSIYDMFSPVWSYFFLLSLSFRSRMD